MKNKHTESKPSTPDELPLEGRAASVAKRRETTRRRTLAELRAEVERVGVMFRHCGEDCPPEVEIAGWTFSRLAYSVLSPRKRLSADRVRRLEEWSYALNDAVRPHPLGTRMVVTIDAEGLRALATAIERRSVAVDVANSLVRLEQTDDDELAAGDEDLVRRLLAPKGRAA